MKETKERINITIDPMLLRSLDLLCKSLNYSRSQFIVRCISKFLKDHFEDGEEL